MNNILQRILRFKQALSKKGPQAMSNAISMATEMDAPEDMAKSVVQGILSTRADEISCDECFVQLDQFAELQLTNATPAEALSLVQDHLNRCKDCREEFEMLMSALEAIP